MNQDVKKVFASYPVEIRAELSNIRALILELAEDEGIGAITETLKWGEPSYITKSGSTVRLGWKQKYEDQFGIYFNCNTSLVETFREIYGDLFVYEGNRALLFKLKEDIPLAQLKQCISMSLRYKLIKKLPLLGA